MSVNLSEQEIEEIKDEVWRLDFGISKSLRYHAYRRSFWEHWDYFAKITSAVSGTAVLVSALARWPEYIAGLSLVVALSSTADSVLGFGNRAKLHDKLYREFAMLGMRLEETALPGEAELKSIRRRRLEIEMEEPTTIGWLERRCAAEECAARGKEVRESYKLHRWQIWLSQFAIFPSIHPKILKD